MLALLVPSALHAADPAPEATGGRFWFGASEPPAGFERVAASTGHGLAERHRFVGPKSPGQSADGVAGEAPFVFAVDLPEGVYDVTVTLGGREAAVTTVKAESRRLMLRQVATAAGATAKRSFTVAVKRPVLQSGRTVRLKPSQGPANWDDALSLEFNGSRPALRSIEIVPAKAPVAVFIAGDSTVTDQDGALYTGWGQMLPCFFRAGAVVYNNAQSGDALFSFARNGLLDQIWERARPGDHLLIQFGHNDQKDQSPGSGPFTSYKANLKRYIAEARKRQVVPVLVTPMERRRFQGDAVVPTLADFAEAVRQTGREEQVPVIDLHAASIRLYTALGAEDSKQAFLHHEAGTAPDGRPEAIHDDTHFSNYGGYELARIVATGIGAAKLDIARFLVDDFRPIDPDHPDDFRKLELPMSPTPTAAAPTKPEGN